MIVFLYEYVTGGGCWSGGPNDPPRGSLLREGSAMAAALAADFQRLPGVEVIAMRDRRLGDWTPAGAGVRDIGGAAEERAAVAQLAARADWTVLIAPESDGALLARRRLVQAAGGRSLSPGPEFIELASDKHRTARRLETAGVPTPQAALLGPDGQAPPRFPFPAVVKPQCGAGSAGVRLVPTPQDIPPPDESGQPRRLERYCPGLPASVAFLCGPDGPTALPPCRQRLSDDGRFRYLGCETPLPDPLARRARRLARRALHALPTTVGYVGVDLVLGPSANGGQDVVIEVNPRLTTSYVALRQLARTNLAQAMLEIAR